MARGASDRVKSASMEAPPWYAARSDATPHRATVAAGFVRGMLSSLPAARARAMLREAGLEASALDPSHRTPITGYANLYNHVVTALGDEGFALFSAPVPRGSFEFLCRGVVGASSLGQALERAARFLALVLPDLRVRIEREARAARILISERRRLRARAGDPRRVFAFEWLLRMLHGVACWLAGRGIALESVDFPYPRPRHAADYALVYTEHSRFGAPALVATLDAAVLDLPVRRDEADLTAFLEGAPGKIAMLYRRDREIARAVREALAGALSESPGFPGLARRLHLSPRTLHRRLAEEGTSYRAIKEAVRRERALQKLEKTRESVASIATGLGYSEPSAFFRAFVGWTGVAPKVWRKRHNSA